MKISDQTDKILPALVKVKEELGVVLKKENNPFYKSKYADLNSHIELVEPLLNKFGLVLMQPCNINFVESIIYDAESGQFVSSGLQLVLAKQDMQQMGSAVTYARRYTLGSLLAMRAEDDDANLASNLNVKKSTNVEEAKEEAKVARPSFRRKIAEAKKEENTPDDI